MQHIRRVRRTVLLALSLLSACAASDPGSGGVRAGVNAPHGVYGNYLAGRFALSEGDADIAATDFLRALAMRPTDPVLLQEAFLASLDAGRPEAIRLARQLPDNQVAQLVVANADATSGDWTAAVGGYRLLPHQGLTQVLQPLLVAWAQQGGGHTGAALSTLQPYVEGPRFRGLFALHAGMIADLGGRQDDAGRLFHIAQTAMPDMNLRLAAILSSWQARNGQPGEAQKTLSDMARAIPESALVLPALMASSGRRPVPNAVDGIAETYIAFAGALRAQDQGEFAMIVTRLALQMRPDFTAARLLAADIQASEHQPEAALRTLSAIPAGDPLDPLVRLRRVALTERLGRSDEAMRELTQLAKNFPDSPVPQEQLGDILRSKDRFPEAVVAYDRAIGLIPHPVQTDWVLFYDRGIALERSHQWNKAEGDFNHALALEPDQPYVLNYLGYAWADMGHHLPEAHQMIQKAAERLPNDGAITDSLGWVEYRQGLVAEAVRTLERAVEMEPEDATINGHLGDAYWAAGRKLEARYQWQRALTLNPEPSDVAKLEAKLKTEHPGPVASGQ